MISEAIDVTLFVTFETFKRSFDIKISDIEIGILEIDLKVNPSEIKIQNSSRKSAKNKKPQNPSLFYKKINPTPRGHIPL